MPQDLNARIAHLISQELTREEMDLLKKMFKIIARAISQEAAEDIDRARREREAAQQLTGSRT